MTLEEVRALDADDSLRGCRDRFFIPEGLIYLDGNSLGVLPRETAARQREVVEREWGSSLIRSWNDHDWIEAPQRIDWARQGTDSLVRVPSNRPERESAAPSDGVAAPWLAELRSALENDRA